MTRRAIYVCLRIGNGVHCAPRNPRTNDPERVTCSACLKFLARLVRCALTPRVTVTMDGQKLEGAKGGFITIDDAFKALPRRIDGPATINIGRKR